MTNTIFKLGKGNVSINGLCVLKDEANLSIGCLYLSDANQAQEVYIEFNGLNSVDNVISILNSIKKMMQE